MSSARSVGTPRTRSSVDAQNVPSKKMQSAFPRAFRTAAVMPADRESPPGDLLGEALERPIEDVPLGEPAPDGVGCIDGDRLRLAEREQAEAVIEVTAREHDARDRRVPRRL